MPTYKNASLTQERIDRLNERSDELIAIAKSLLEQILLMRFYEKTLYCIAYI